jgi:prevent-host-death family protein
MSITIGIYEAKTKLSQIIERVINGEEFVITKHDKVVARIIPERTTNNKELISAYEKFKKDRVKLNQKNHIKLNLKELARTGLA